VAGCVLIDVFSNMTNLIFGCHSIWRIAMDCI
jgi:hypothetical protein